MTPPIPAARLIRRGHWRDARLWIGLALIIVSMVVGARVLAASQHTVTVWQAERDLAPGSAPLVRPVAVALGPLADAYARADAPLTGRMREPVAAGALVPVGAVGDPAPSDVRLVTVPVEPLHAPVGLAAGDVVDVWVSASDAGQVPQPSALVREGVLVSDVASDTVGVGGQIAVVLEVPASDVAGLVQAMRGGAVDLVRVPDGRVAS